MAKNKLVKVIAAIASIAVIAGGSIFLYNSLSKDPNQPGGPGTNPVGPGTDIVAVQLEAPEQLAFNDQNYILSWEEVDNATGYTIYYNGQETTVDADDTQEHITITSEDNYFKVKALGDGELYKDSEWSQEISYTMEKDQEQSVFEKVNLKLAQSAQDEGLKLESVIGISYVDLAANEYSENIVFQTICSKNGVSSNYEFSYKNDGYTASIEELLENFDHATFKSKLKKDTVDYQSAQYLINSKLYAGQMAELYNQGYEISVINSAVREGKKVGSKFRYEIVGTYKAERDGDVKYFTSINRVDIANPSSDASYNYEVFLAAEDLRTLTETEFIMHEPGETLEYMGEWAAKNEAASTASAVSYKISVPFYSSSNRDDGMEM